ncbi:NUDIX hydrolase [Aestuariibius sp. HNIBRBA575]|uniref:NUDIX hydrolase n=1 Tax=Aestuariibius sp. HNIBRBA575 TaxID=3233343 RepID=UPI0034A2E177
MKAVLSDLWTEFVHPMLQRPKRIQFAALCYRTEKSGRKILLITSRDTGRWIIPKGWPIAGTTSTETALQEAWEEAGVKSGDPEKRALGSYTYDKGMKAGWTQPVKTMVYSVAVTQMSDVFPEDSQRHREWFSPSEAANLVQEPELKELLINFGQS